VTGGPYREPPADMIVDEPFEIPQVAASEHDMIMMARALIQGPAAHDDIWALLCATRPVAPKIGPTCAELLEDTLQHAWRALWLRGGTRPSASIVSSTGGGGGTARGRLWERHAPLPLAFTSSTLKFLRWLVATSFAAPPSTLPVLHAAPLAMGDQVLIYLALDAVAATPALRVLASQPFVRASPLAWLGFAHLFARRDAQAPVFDELVEGVGSIVVEALSGELGRRWQRAELQKRGMTDPAALVELGAAQDQTLQRFMDACETSGRRDLATFVIDAAAPLLARNLPPTPAQLDPTATLAARSQGRIAVGSLLRAVVRWADWDQGHRGVRFIDDDYAAAQLLLERFELIGAAGVARAAHWLTDLASLVPTTANLAPDDSE
jgi:hypothetical protein